MKSIQGFSLVEVLISLLLVSFIMLNLINSFRQTTHLLGQLFNDFYSSLNSSNANEFNPIQ